VPIVGVAPAGFTGLEVGRAFDVAVPICSHETLGAETGWLDDGMTWWLTVMGRRRPGEALDAVGAELEARSAALFEETLPPDYPAERTQNYLDHSLRAAPGAAGVSSLRGRYGDALVILLSITGLDEVLRPCGTLQEALASISSEH